MEPLYDPQGVEERWQQTWEDEGLYGADPEAARETFVVAHPPPNVTGELHTGARAPDLARRRARALAADAGLRDVRS